MFAEYREHLRDGEELTWSDKLCQFLEKKLQILWQNLYSLLLSLPHILASAEFKKSALTIITGLACCKISWKIIKSIDAQITRRTGIIKSPRWFHKFSITRRARHAGFNVKWYLLYTFICAILWSICAILWSLFYTMIGAHLLILYTGNVFHIFGHIFNPPYGGDSWFLDFTKKSWEKKYKSLERNQYFKDVSWCKTRFNTKSRKLLIDLMYKANDEQTYDSFYGGRFITLPMLIDHVFQYLDKTELLDYTSRELPYERFSYNEILKITEKEEYRRRKLPRRVREILRKISNRNIPYEQNRDEWIEKNREKFPSSWSKSMLRTYHRIRWDLAKTTLPNFDRSMYSLGYRPLIYPKRGLKESLLRIGPMLHPSYLHFHNRYFLTPSVYTIMCLSMDLAKEHPIPDVFYDIESAKNLYLRNPYRPYFVYGVWGNNITSIPPNDFLNTEKGLNVAPEHIFLAMMKLSSDPQGSIESVRKKNPLGPQTADLGIDLHEFFRIAGRINGHFRHGFDVSKLVEKVRAKVVALSDNSVLYNFYGLESEFRKDYSAALKWYGKALSREDNPSDRVHILDNLQRVEDLEEFDIRYKLVQEFYKDKILESEFKKDYSHALEWYQEALSGEDNPSDRAHIKDKIFYKIFENLGNKCKKTENE